MILVSGLVISEFYAEMQKDHVKKADLKLAIQLQIAEKVTKVANR